MRTAADQLRAGDRFAAATAVAARPMPSATATAETAGGFAERMRLAAGRRADGPATERSADRLELREQLRRVAVRPSGPEAAALADPRAAARRSASARACYRRRSCSAFRSLGSARFRSREILMAGLGGAGRRSSLSWARTTSAFTRTGSGRGG